MLLNSKKYNCSKDAFDWAAAMGYLKILKYLHSIHCSYFNECDNEYIIWRNLSSMDLAAANGHINIVKYLSKIGQIYTFYTVECAIQHNHIKIVKLLSDFIKTEEEATTNAMYYATKKEGSLKMVRYLLSINIAYDLKDINRCKNLKIKKYLLNLQK